MNIELTEIQQNYLSSFPEAGMGYQLVNVELNNGLILHNRIVLNSKYLTLNEGELLKIEDIADIYL